MLGSYGTAEDRIFSVHNPSRSHADKTGWSATAEDETGVVASPVFLVGSVRSGTTLLRLMLNHHPELAFFHEFQYVVEAIPEAGWPILGDYYQYLRGHRIFQDSHLSIDTRLDYPQLMNSFLRQKRDRDDKKHVGATVHIHFDRLTRIWPDARFIHIVRDGRDVGRSRIEMGWAGNMYTGVDAWIEAERLWERVRAELPASRRIEVKYEDLINDAEMVLTKICDFLDLPFDRSMLRYDEYSTYAAPDRNLIGQWRRKLPPEAVRLAEARIADMLVERGYELSGHEPLQIGPVREWLVRMDDRKNRLAARRKQYGNQLFAAEMAMRLLEPAYRSLATFRTNVRERINNTERASLK